MMSWCARHTLWTYLESLGMSVVTSSMRCIPKVSEWSGISPWFVSMVSLWDRIGMRVMIGMMGLLSWF